MDLLFTELASSPMFIGVTMVIMNLGSRFVMADISKAQESMLASELAKMLVVFCIFFVPTRNIMAACMLTFAFYFVTKDLLNENKRHSIIAGLPGFAGGAKAPEAFVGESADKVDRYALYLNELGRRRK